MEIEPQYIKAFEVAKDILKLNDIVIGTSTIKDLEITRIQYNHYDLDIGYRVTITFGCGYDKGIIMQDVTPTKLFELKQGIARRNNELENEKIVKEIASKGSIHNVCFIDPYKKDKGTVMIYSPARQIGKTWMQEQQRLYWEQMKNMSGINKSYFQLELRKDWFKPEYNIKCKLDHHKQYKLSNMADLDITYYEFGNKRKVTIATTLYPFSIKNGINGLIMGYSIMNPTDERNKELGEHIAKNRLKLFERFIELPSKPSKDTIKSLAKDYYHYLMDTKRDQWKTKIKKNVKRKAKDKTN